MATDTSKRGLLFQRPHKTGSTTLAGIVMRIAHRRAQRQVLERPLLQNSSHVAVTSQVASDSTNNISSRSSLCCDHRANHGSAVHYQYALRDKNQSFLISIVRNPTRRVISHFFHFGVAAYRHEPTDFNFISHVWGQVPRNSLIQELSLYPLNETNVTSKYTRAVDDILRGYDFIVLLERFDESLVALKMLLGLDFEDILYVRERSEGTFSNGYSDRPCMFIPQSFVSPYMQDYFLSDAWMDRIEGDVMLYRAVHMSLDRTIDLLGREEFQRQLIFFRHVNHRAQELCASRSVGMCSDGGMPIPEENRTCYIWSEGCSHACLDEIKISMIRES